jgi:hypothetical protein
MPKLKSVTTVLQTRAKVVNKVQQLLEPSMPVDGLPIIQT